MKKTASYIALLIMALAFGACSDDFAQPPVIMPEEGLGTGLWNDPYRVSQLTNGGKGNEIWITGYIVGWINTEGDNFKMNEQTCTFTVPATLNSNILMATSPDETDWEKCIPVALSGSARDALNLVSHPENLGKQVTLKGNNERYFSQNSGFKNITAYKWGAEGIEEEIPTGSEIYSATFDNGDLCGFTFDDILLPEGVSSVWRSDSRYGLVASAYIGGTRYQTESRAISPVIDLTGYSSASMTWRWAANYFTNQQNFSSMCDFAIRTEGSSEWIATEVPVLPSGADFTYVDSGTIDLTPYAGKKIQFSFRYSSTSSLCGTLEVDNIKVSAGK